ncbi:MAG: oligosaccharide flippase family protein [Anaerolineae bacterium]|jgi:O-antigen/teichoic acid export membrane protein
MAVGTFGTLSVHGLLLPVGMLTVAFLTRQLGPELYGTFTVAASIVQWIQVSTRGLFDQTTVKFVAEAEERQRIASGLAQAQLVVSLAFAGILAATAPVLADWLRAPDLAPALRLFAVDVPLFCLARAHRSILIGHQEFWPAAILTGIYGLSRMVLVFVLVGTGLSTTGAILAAAGASLAQLTVARLYVRPRLLVRVRIPVRRLTRYAMPLFLNKMGRNLFGRVGLFVVQAVSDVPGAAGYYGAAQELNRPFGLFAASLAPPFLATLALALRRGETDTARPIVTQSMRLVLCLLPLAAAAAGSAESIVGLVYGREFLPTSSIFALLAIAGAGNVLTTVNAEALIALGRPTLPFAITGPLMPLALGAHLILVPRFGPDGAAAATLALSWFGAGATAFALHRKCEVQLPWASLPRIGIVSLASYALSRLLPSAGGWTILELGGLAIGVAACLFAVGELGETEIAFARSLVAPGRAAGQGN